MNDISNLAQIQQLLETIEKDLQTAKQIIQGMVGEIPQAGSESGSSALVERAKTLNVSEGGKIIEGVFDGQNMVGPDGKIYPVPANYASKSKLLEGDVLKLTIAPDGSFIYKQISPVDRKRILGILVQDDKGDYRVVAEGKSYKVLLASLTYYKAEPGDQVTLLVPTDQETAWAAVENVIKQDEIQSGPRTVAAAQEKSEDVETVGEDEPETEEGEPDDDVDRQVRILTGDDNE